MQHCPADGNKDADSAVISMAVVLRFKGGKAERKNYRNNNDRSYRTA